jgi:hypothetical protein
MITNDREDGSLWYVIACGVLLVVAAGIRVRFLGTTLFEDEVWVANLVRRGGWHPHSYATPPLFYAIERAWISIRGISDVALREPPAFFGVALCALPHFSARPRVTRLLWATLLAFSGPLIFYSERAKQYTLEAFVVTVLILLFLRILEAPSVPITIIFFLLAALGATTLHAPVVVIGAMAVLCLRRPRMLAGFVVIGALWIVAYVGWMKPGPETTLLHGDLDQFFAMGGRWVTTPRLFLSDTLQWVGQALNLIRFWWLVIPLLVFYWLARERNIVIPTLAILPPLAIVAASTVHVYPYGEIRLMVFCFPALFLLFAESLTVAARRVPVLLLLLIPFVFDGAAHDTYNVTYMKIYDLRPMFEAIVRSHVPGEAIYAHPSFAEPLRYEYPSVSADIHSGFPNAVTKPGWYIQRVPEFALPAANATTAFRIGDVIAVRSTAPSP